MTKQAGFDLIFSCDTLVELIPMGMLHVSLHFNFRDFEDSENFKTFRFFIFFTLSIPFLRSEIEVQNPKI